MAKPSTMSSVFLYFAYGSNLFAERIHANNPTAIRKGIGKLNVRNSSTSIRLSYRHFIFVLLFQTLQEFYLIIQL